ncbi:hypothetical protein Atep_21330 [Allochromatium tepidum]|uniref:Uncharacterized protein n=1 Tax=Allochromatium tepidum TaxID=553982 RepID=A0ABM7QPA8_9GAMM|nr:hypothetical protein [Allochromatium tepidum]BCU07456.1 hypothetical protein Atep_21330 [Allochromatium tepidum]
MSSSPYTASAMTRTPLLVRGTHEPIQGRLRGRTVDQAVHDVARELDVGENAVMALDEGTVAEPEIFDQQSMTPLGYEREQLFQTLGGLVEGGPAYFEDHRAGQEIGRGDGRTKGLDDLWRLTFFIPCRP